jgi:glucuronoarabinoxylan endo-1,4-beta-xylanase
MLDINDLWFQQIKGDYYFKDIKLGDLADRPLVVAHPTLNPIPSQVIVKGEKVRPILLTGINDGLGKPTATLTAFADKPNLVSGLSIGNIINGTALLNYSLNAVATDTIRISVIAQNTSSPNSVNDTVTFKVYAIDKATMASGGAVNIDFSKTYQSFAGMGTMLNNGSNYDQVQQIKDLNITTMRLTSDGEFEPVNDNPDPNVTDYSNFNRKALPTDIIREINEKTNCHKFFYTPWSPPNWMKMNKGSNPDPATMWAGNNKLKPEMYEEFAEYLVAICKTIQEEAGVELYAISLQNEPTFNEPYASCQYTGAEFRDMMKIIGPRFKAENIQTRIMMPEDIATMLDWVTEKINPVNADPEAKEYLGIMAVHLYDPDGINVGGAGASRWKDLLKIKNTTVAEGLWMTETSGFGNVWEGYWGKDYLSGNPQFFPGPLDFAGSMYTAFKAGQISSWTDFEGTAFKIKNNLAGSVFKNFSAYLNPGAIMVDAVSTNSKVLSLAFKNSDQSVTSILLNTSKTPLKVTLKGKDVPKYFRAFTTEDSAPFVEGSNITDATVVLPPRSITTLYHSTGNLPPTADQAENRYLELAAGEQNIALTGISFGADTTLQSVVSIKAIASNPGVVNAQVEFQAGAKTANLKLTPLNFGTSLVSVTVKDNGGIAGGGVDTLSMKFYVSVISKLNHNPTLNELAPITASEDTDSVRIDLSGISDGDNGTQALQFSISNTNPDLVRPRISFVEGSDKASIVFKPLANSNGTDMFTVILTDLGGDANNNGDLSTKLEVPVMIVPVNDAPVIKAILTTASVKGGILKRFPITFEDGDPEINQTLSYVIRNPNPDIADASLTVGQPNALTLNVTGKKIGVANLTFVLKDDGGTLNGGIDTSKIVFTVNIQTTVGIEELNSTGISLFPNPANDYVTLKVNNEKFESIVVTDVSGNIVLKQAIINENNEYKLLISKLPSGVYFVTVKHGQQTNTLRFIHQK